MKVNFNPIQVNEDYRKKWNLYNNDFVVIATKDGEIISDTLYRKGGMWSNPTPQTKYVLILKHIENKKTKHLDSEWCIIDENGNEKVVFERSLDSAYLIDETQMFIYKGCVWNIETNQIVSKYNGSIMKSDDFIFFANEYDNNKSKRGVWKICKKTCAVELFKGK